MFGFSRIGGKRATTRVAPTNALIANDKDYSDDHFYFFRDAEAVRAGFFPSHKLQIFCGVSGMSMWLMPNGASASTTALTIAGVDPIVPASPMPLMPSGFTGVGVSVRAKLKCGKLAARGTA